MAVAVVHHLNGSHDDALRILEKYEESANLPNVVPLKDVEAVETAIFNTELYLYHNLLLQESGDFAKAMKHLDLIENFCFEKLWIKEKRGLIDLIDLIDLI